MTAAPIETAARIAKPAAAAMRAAIRLAGGREVCFVATLDETGAIETVRPVARGDSRAVLALPGVAQRGQMLVHNHPTGNLEPSEADMAVASRIHDDGVGFAIIDNVAERMYVVVEVPKPKQHQPLSADGVDHDLGALGAIARHHTRFEDRPSQRAMAARIARLYTDGGVGLLEAGTGVGKSLAYLVPALRWAAANGERTIVSTNTITLQEQLVGKDLPFLKTAFSDQRVSFALLKGWSNYVCLMRLEQASGAGAGLFEDGIRQELDMLKGWAARTSDGSLADLPTPPRQEVWDEVVAESDLCQRAKCSLFDKCFVFQARRKAAAADVVVVNHHLLLADVAVRRASGNWGDAAVLPAYTRLVIDEGHHLEDTAANHLGATVSHRGLMRLFNRLERRGGKGMLPLLLTRLAASKEIASKASLDIVRNSLIPSVERVRASSDGLFNLLGSLLSEQSDPTFRLTPDFAMHPIWRMGLKRALDDTATNVESIRRNLELVRERMDRAETPDETTAPVINELRSIVRRLALAHEALITTLEPRPGETSIRWIETRGRDRAVVASSVPLDLAPILRDDLFARATTTIVTSATLATDPKFHFLTERLGLNTSELEPYTEVYSSPFDFREQAMIAVPTDIPAPNANAAGHAAALIRIVLDVAEAAAGGLFVLFTSHRDVRAAAAELRTRAIERRRPLLVHGEDSRDALLARFRDSGRALLLGTSSFWEGVDVPGDALHGLIIAKIPFKVPNEPVTAGHCEAIAAAGGDPFTEYMVPHASLRLKQGFGRLIRTATDRGVVVIADPRLVAKRYGKDLLAALPPAPRVKGTWDELRPRIIDFYKR